LLFKSLPHKIRQEKTVVRAAIRSGVARVKLSEEEVMRNTQQMVAQHKVLLETIWRSTPAGVCM
jgi:hypothetical protein